MSDEKKIFDMGRGVDAARSPPPSKSRPREWFEELLGKPSVTMGFPSIATVVDVLADAEPSRVDDMVAAMAGAMAAKKTEEKFLGEPIGVDERGDPLHDHDPTARATVDVAIHESQAIARAVAQEAVDRVTRSMREQLSLICSAHEALANALDELARNNAHLHLLQNVESEVARARGSLQAARTEMLKAAGLAPQKTFLRETAEMPTPVKLKPKPPDDDEDSVVDDESDL